VPWCDAVDGPLELFGCAAIGVGDRGLRIVADRLAEVREAGPALLDEGFAQRRVAHDALEGPATASGDLSCNSFCDYHDSANGPNGPFYTVEPYPCAQGCNQCTQDPFDTLTQGLSEEMVELKTDMDPGTGWVIGNEEICDYCDANFVCNSIATGEYVNSWYDKSKNACWIGRK